VDRGAALRVALFTDPLDLQLTRAARPDVTPIREAHLRRFTSRRGVYKSQAAAPREAAAVSVDAATGSSP